MRFAWFAVLAIAWIALAPLPAVEGQPAAQAYRIGFLGSLASRRDRRGARLTPLTNTVSWGTVSRRYASRPGYQTAQSL